MFQFCFFISIAYSYCIETKPAPVRVEVHYSKVVERATEMITRHEGLRLEAYQDTNGLYSIGYGTRSYAGETITKEEAYRRMLGVVSNGVHNVMRDFPYASEGEIVALTSIYYNCWSGWLEIKKKGPEAMLRPGFCQLPGYSGLVKRRAEERALFAFDAE